MASIRCHGIDGLEAAIFDGLEAAIFARKVLSCGGVAGWLDMAYLSTEHVVCDSNHMHTQPNLVGRDLVCQKFL